MPSRRYEYCAQPSINVYSGKSAYLSAVENGYCGSELEWVATLKGERGETGEDGESITGPPGQSITGPPGQSITGPPGEDGQDTRIVIMNIYGSNDDVDCEKYILPTNYSLSKLTEGYNLICKDENIIEQVLVNAVRTDGVIKREGGTPGTKDSFVGYKKHLQLGGGVFNCKICDVGDIDDEGLIFCLINKDPSELTTITDSEIVIGIQAVPPQTTTETNILYDGYSWKNANFDNLPPFVRVSSTDNSITFSHDLTIEFGANNTVEYQKYHHRFNGIIDPDTLMITFPENLNTHHSSSTDMNMIAVAVSTSTTTTTTTGHTKYKLWKNGTQTISTVDFNKDIDSIFHIQYKLEGLTAGYCFGDEYTELITLTSTEVAALSNEKLYPCIIFLSNAISVNNITLIDQNILANLDFSTLSNDSDSGCGGGGTEVLTKEELPMPSTLGKLVYCSTIDRLLYYNSLGKWCRVDNNSVFVGSPTIVITTPPEVDGQSVERSLVFTSDNIGVLSSSLTITGSNVVNVGENTINFNSLSAKTHENETFSVITNDTFTTVTTIPTFKVEIAGIHPGVKWKSINYGTIYERVSDDGVSVLTMKKTGLTFTFLPDNVVIYKRYSYTMNGVVDPVTLSLTYPTNISLNMTAILP